MLDADAAEHQRHAFAERVSVDAETDAEVAHAARSAIVDGRVAQARNDSSRSDRGLTTAPTLQPDAAAHGSLFRLGAVRYSLISD
jgi:hypothetical protein